MKAKELYHKLKDTDCTSYNMPTGARKVWHNKWGRGYVFDDGSRFNHYNKELGVYTILHGQNYGKQYNYWAEVSWGDASHIWAVGQLKYEVK